MGPLGGGMKKKKSKGVSYKKGVKRGGSGFSVNLSPAPFSGLDNTLPEGMTNNAKLPDTFPSNQVGGAGYGFSNGGDAAQFNGGYFPTTSYPGDESIPARGGNNFMTGGRRRRRRSTKRKSKRSRKHKKTTKWKQIGCKKGY